MGGRIKLKKLVFAAAAVALLILLPGLLPAAEPLPVEPASPAFEPPTIIDPGDTWTQFTFGYQAYHIEGDLQTARERFERALAGDTGFARARYWLGKSYYALGYNTRALELWEEGRYFSGERRTWFENLVAAHRRRYAPPPARETVDDWRLVYRISGQSPGRSQNLNTAAVAGDPVGGFYSSSYRQGRVFRFSEEGKMLERWTGFSRPVSLEYLDGRGLLVAEYDADRIRIISRSGEVELFADSELEAPYRIFSSGQSVYSFNDSSDRIVRFSMTGEYLGTVWEAPLMDEIDDVAMSPEEDFWLLDREENRLIVINSDGDREAEYPLINWPQIKNIWWRRGALYGDSAAGLLRIQPEGEPRFLRDRGERIEGGDISDLYFSGDRLILTKFNESTTLIFRPEDIDQTDIIVADGRVQFDDYPVVRMSIQIEDPLESGRFQRLGNRNLGVTIEGLRALPSLLEPARNYYSPSWFLILDEGHIGEAAWEELEPFLARLIEQSPAASRGSIWSTTLPERPVVQPLTNSRERLLYVLNRQRPYRAGHAVDDQQFAALLHELLDLAFRRRGPTGIIVVSPRFSGDQRFQRLANRLRNNLIPVSVITPSFHEKPDDRPLFVDANAGFFNLGRLSVPALWEHYEKSLSSHYLALFRSPIDRIEPGAWRRYELEFHYLDSLFRFPHGYQLP